MTPDEYNEQLQEMRLLDREIAAQDEENQNVQSDDARYMAEYAASFTKPPIYRRLYSGFLRLVHSRTEDRTVSSRSEATRWHQTATKTNLSTKQKRHTSDDEPPNAA